MPNLANTGLEYPAVNDPAYKNLFGTLINAIMVAFDALLYTRTANYNFADYVLSRATIKDCAEQAYNAGNISGAVAIDYTNGHYQYATLTGNITSLTVSNWPASGTVGFMTLELNQGAGGFTIALSSAYDTAGGFGITLTQTASAIDKLRLETRDAGTSIFASVNLDVK